MIELKIKKKPIYENVHNEHWTIAGKRRIFGTMVIEIGKSRDQ